MRKGEKSAARRIGTRNWIGNLTLGGKAIFTNSPAHLVENIKGADVSRAAGFNHQFR